MRQRCENAHKMWKRNKDAGLWRHRPKKPFRLEYIIGKFSGLNRKGREERLLDEVLDESLGYLDLLDRWEKSKRGKWDK